MRPTPEANSLQRLVPAPGGGWRWHRWASAMIVAGVTDRHTSVDVLLQGFMKPPPLPISAEQVHGASLAVVERRHEAAHVAGCDGLVTHVPGIALLVRTADCIPMFFADPIRRVVGLAHVGWRGLTAQLPMRMIMAFRHIYASPPRDVRVAFGPAIRSCCYTVGAEFVSRFGRFVQERDGALVCDLIAAASAQVFQCGVTASHLTDTQECTGCVASRWYSLRREGPHTGRLVSAIMLRA